MYHPDDLSQMIHEAVVTLKEKMTTKLPNLRTLDYMKDKYTFALNFLPHRFPHLPTSEMTLDFAPLFPRWFVCGEFIKGRKNECLKPAQRMTPTKYNIYYVKGHLHIDVSHVRVETPIHEGEESHKISSPIFQLPPISSCIHI